MVRWQIFVNSALQNKLISWVYATLTYTSRWEPWGRHLSEEAAAPSGPPYNRPKGTQYGQPCQGFSFFGCYLATHRRSVAKRGGCFQRRLFVWLSVCACVCLLVCTITSEQLNVGRSNLAVRHDVQKSRPSSKVKVKDQRSKSPETKKRKTAESSHWQWSCAVARSYAASSNRRCHCVAIQGRQATPVGKSSYVCMCYVMLRHTQTADTKV